MLCKKCGNEKPDSARMKNLNDFKVPFRCPSCGGIDIGLELNNDKILLWPESLPESIGGIVIPEVVRHAYANEVGVVVAAGKGHTDKKGNFHKVEVVPGDLVLYDKSVPWSLSRKDKNNGNKVEELKLMGFQDVLAIVTER